MIDLVDHWADLLAWLAIGGDVSDLPALGVDPDDVDCDDPTSGPAPLSQRDVIL